jgi:pyruvate dehydrogenase E2 component (dihydrolipoamide acetyltransferase)
MYITTQYRHLIQHLNHYFVYIGLQIALEASTLNVSSSCPAPDQRIRRSAMPFLLVPDAGDEAATATLIRWLAVPGDLVAPGGGLAEFEVENGSLIIEAAASGRLAELLVQPGKTVIAGAKLARFEISEAAGTNLVKQETAMPDANLTRAGKVIPILMPQAGNTMEEGTVISWRVKEGDRVAIGQVICEIETDKATIDFDSPDAGRLARIVAPAGEPVAVKKTIALLAESDADADAYLANLGQPAESTKSSLAAATFSNAEDRANRNRSTGPAPMTGAGRAKASPAARKMATKRGIALAAVGAGSGPAGRILSSDLTNVDLPRGSATSTCASEVRRPLSKMRRAIGINLQQSKQTVPHFYVRTTIDAHPLLAFYREQKMAANCTLNDVIVLAVGRAIREFPAVRSQIVDNEVIEYPHANIGIAVGVDEGLVVPVVLAVDTLSLTQLAAETKRVVEQARNGRLENIGKAHFTISNLGMFGVEEFSAIINPPESGILAVSAAREAVVVKDGAMRIGHQMTITLSADHRIVDGVMAAKFMQRLQAILEHPGDELAK